MKSSVYKPLFIVGWLCMLWLFTGCLHRKEAATPKPIAYFRIDLPEHQYQILDTFLPCSFERSECTEVKLSKQPNGAIWMDVAYPDLDAVMKCTYFPIRCADSLRNLIVNEEKMVKFHYQKADDVQYSVIKDPEAQVWGQLYDIEGRDVATPFMFWMTDSAHHFLRGTLYFNFTPNNDSLEPVIQYLREDAMHMVSTFQWK